MTDDTPSKPVDLFKIEFPPRVNLAFAAEEDGVWIGGFFLSDGRQQTVMASQPGEMTRYAFIARMHELASQHKVELQVHHQHAKVEILNPLR